MSEEPRIDRVQAQYFRKGKCAACGGSVERLRTFTGLSLAETDAQAKVWTEETALLHKRCEGYA